MAVNVLLSSQPSRCARLCPYGRSLNAHDGSQYFAEQPASLCRAAPIPDEALRLAATSVFKTDALEHST